MRTHFLFTLTLMTSLAAQAQEPALNDPAVLEASLRQQWAGIDAELKLRAYDEAALGEAKRWQSAEDAPLPAAGKDGRVLFVFGATVPRVICAPLRICDVELQAGETIHDALAGDTARWNIEPAMSGMTPHLVIKPLSSGVSTNLAVYTDRRVYHLELVATKSEHMPLVAFDYPEDRKARWAALAGVGTGANGAGASAKPRSEEYEIEANPGSLNFAYSAKKAGRWRMRRHIDWLPTRVYDDGQKTIIEMPRSVLMRELPVLFLREGGTNKIVNFRVKGRHFIVDRLFQSALLVKGVGRRQERVAISREED